MFGKDSSVRIWSADPLNAEPDPARIVGHALTPLEHFYVRNHGSLPELAPERHRVVVDGLVERRLELTLRELRERFRPRAADVTLQCAGNRRADLIAVRDIPGEIAWGPGTIGTARWAGVALADVLAAAGPRPEARHVAFTGADDVVEDGRDVGFGGSVPLEQAGDALLAWAMNGAPLPAVHGGPLRAVVPAQIGARSVKWLTRIELRADPSDNHFQRAAYRLVPPGSDDPASGLMLGAFPVNSAICAPADGATLAAGPTVVAGWAIGGAGRPVSRVDVSADGGTTWSVAALGRDLGPAAWRWWEATVDLRPGEHELVARAWDTAAATQPERAASLWNLKGYMSCACPRARVRVTA